MAHQHNMGIQSHKLQKHIYVLISNGKMVGKIQAI